MSQHRRKTQSQRHFSQASTSAAAHDIDYDENATLGASQISPDKTLSSHEKAHQVSKVVKYILAASHSNQLISKPAISKAVDCHNRNFVSVMSQARKQLLDVFGYRVIDVDSKLFLQNTIENEDFSFDEQEKNRSVLLFFTLTHIFMSGEQCTENSVVDFLCKLGIIADGNFKHNLFGDVIDLITNEFVKEGYIDVIDPKKDKEHTEGQEKELRWGVRAHAEVSLRSIMQFMCQIYNERDMERWPQQFEIMLRRETEANEENGNGVED